MTIIQSTHGIETGIVARIAGVYRAIQETRQRNRVYRQTQRELGSLTDRDLTDLGIHRSMISRVAHEAAYGK